MSSLSYAADLPSRALAPAPIYVAPAFTWTGFYVGGNVGAAWSGRDNCPLGHNFNEGVYVLDGTFTPNCNSDRSTNFIGGIQAGYNWQFGGWLLGLEGDINWIGRNNNRGYDYATWYAFVAPAGTPKPLLEKLSADITATLNGNEMKQRFLSLGLEPRPSRPEVVDQLIRSEITRWGPVVRGAGIQAQ
jgi:opacity protein-like surface antigen